MVVSVIVPPERGWETERGKGKRGGREAGKAGGGVFWTLAGRAGQTHSAMCPGRRVHVGRCRRRRARGDYVQQQLAFRVSQYALCVDSCLLKMLAPLFLLTGKREHFRRLAAKTGVAFEAAFAELASSQCFGAVKSVLR